MNADAAPARPSRWRLGGILTHTVLMAGAVVMLYPLFWLALSSLKSEVEIFANSTLLPTTPRFDNYVRGWNGIQVPFGHFFVNSLLIAGAAIVGNVVSCSLAAYAFARLEFPLKRVLFALMLGTIMLPHHATLIPQYIIFLKLGWVNTFLPLIAPKFLAVDAFFVFLMVQFIRSIPRELDEAACIDGASSFTIYVRLMLPLMTPAMVATAIFTFIWTYDDFFAPLIYLGDNKLYTVPQGLRLMSSTTGQSSWGPLLAMSTLSLVPLLVVFLFFQRKLIDGIASTGLKG